MGPKTALLMFSVIVGAAQPPVGAERDAEEMGQTLRRVGADHPFSMDRHVLGQVKDAGITEAVLDHWLELLSSDCLTQERRCVKAIRDFDTPIGFATGNVLALLGELGSSTSVPLLKKLEARGLVEAGSSLQSIQTRLFASTHRDCTPPSEAEVTALAGGLSDFAVFAYDHGKLTARAPDATERADLAYLLAATGGVKASLKELYDAVLPPGRQCATGVDLDVRDELQRRIRAAERGGKCRNAAAYRMLLRQDGLSDKDIYGVAQLRSWGFDVARLYRGALVTVNRGLPIEQLRSAVRSSALPTASALLHRLEDRGSEDWDTATHSLEGFAAEVGERALPRLFALAEGAAPEVRTRSLRALNQLGSLDDRKGCDPSGCKRDSTAGEFSSADTLFPPLRSLDSRCETALSNAERDGFTQQLVALLGDRSPEIRADAANALRRGGSEAAVPALRDRLGDLASVYGSFGCGQAPCDVSQIARTALGQIALRTQEAREAHLCRLARSPMSSFRLEAAAGQIPALMGSAVEGLLDPARRDQTFCELLAAKRLAPGAHAADACVAGDPPLTEVIVAPQEEGPPLLAAFHPLSVGDDDSRPGLPSGVFVIFDREGRELPIFANANMLEPPDAAFRFDGQRIALGQVILYSPAERKTVQVLHVVPISTDPIPLLSVILGRTTDDDLPSSEDPWTWRLMRDPKGRAPRIEIGPLSKLANGRPAAVYRWSSERKEYVGPDGGPALGFLRLRLSGDRNVFSFLKSWR